MLLFSVVKRCAIYLEERETVFLSRLDLVLVLGVGSPRLDREQLPAAGELAIAAGLRPRALE